MDPLVALVAQVFTVPLRELYGLLWRVGVIEIVEMPAASLESSHEAWEGDDAATPDATSAAAGAAVRSA